MQLSRVAFLLLFAFACADSGTAWSNNGAFVGTPTVWDSGPYHLDQATITIDDDLDIDGATITYDGKCKIIVFPGTTSVAINFDAVTFEQGYPDSSLEIIFTERASVVSIIDSNINLGHFFGPSTANVPQMGIVNMEGISSSVVISNTKFSVRLEDDWWAPDTYWNEELLQGSVLNFYGVSGDVTLDAVKVAVNLDDEHSCEKTSFEMCQFCTEEFSQCNQEYFEDLDITIAAVSILNPFGDTDITNLQSSAPGGMYVEFDNSGDVHALNLDGILLNILGIKYATSLSSNGGQVDRFVNITGLTGSDVDPEFLTENLVQDLYLSSEGCAAMQLSGENLRLELSINAPWGDNEKDRYLSVDRDARVTFSQMDLRGELPAYCKGPFSNSSLTTIMIVTGSVCAAGFLFGIVVFVVMNNKQSASGRVRAFDSPSDENPYAKPYQPQPQPQPGAPPMDDGDLPPPYPDQLEKK